MPDRVALVTGGSRGIGRATAVALARSGHAVAINYRSSVEDAKATLAEIERIGSEGVVVEADVCSAEQVDAMFDYVQESLGPVEVLVNNAGVRIDGLAARMGDPAWDAVLRTNLSGAFFCARRALRSMIVRRWGRIVNVSSVAGISGSPGQANYSAAKAGIIGLTKSLAREVARKNVTVNAVAPGLVRTQLTESLSDAQIAALEGEIPMGRSGTAEEIADVIAFIASDKAGYVTGTTFVVDGGMTA